MSEDTNTPPLPQTGNAVASLLKAPGSVVEAIANRKRTVTTGITLLVAAIVFHAIFGLAIGFFGGWSVAVMDVVKVPLVAVCSLFLCYPSLYVFSCVGGVPLSLSQTFALGASCLAMIGLLLVGLAPVAWLFAVSTASIPFITILALGIWCVAGGFAVKYIGKLQTHILFSRTGGIKVWFVIWVVVTMQMFTCMRPILVQPDNETGWWTSQKLFFLQHLGSTFDVKK